MTHESSLEARVLVCDPDNTIFAQLADIFHKRFGTGVSPSVRDLFLAQMLGARDRGISVFEHGNVEFTLVSDVHDIPEMVTSRSAPHYSLVIYESAQVEKEGSARIIGRVNRHDFFLPQMIVGKGLRVGTAAQCARAGALYFADTNREAMDQISKIYKRSQQIPGLTVVKIGGSAFDYDRQVRNDKNLEEVCKILARLREEGNNLLVTAGAGQFGDNIKDFRGKYGDNERVREQYPKSIAKALQANLELIKSLFPGGASMLLDTGAFYYINKKSVGRKIPLIGTAPHYIMARDGVPLQDSDTHTIALAEFYGAERVVLIKRTDGVYDFDPYRGFVFDASASNDNYCANLGYWKRQQRGNKRHKRVTVRKILDGVMKREGTGLDGRADGTSGHLMEDSALRYMVDRCQHVQEIVIVHIAPDELHEWARYHRDGEERDEYRHIITGDSQIIPAGKYWRGILEDNLRAALRGEAKSKIVRE